MTAAIHIGLSVESPTEEYTVFAMSTTGEVVGQSGKSSEPGRADQANR
jgi:hypothetical protein